MTRHRPIWKWLQTIQDDGVRKQAMQNYTRQKNAKGGKGHNVRNLAEAINEGMVWSETPEGPEYWRIIYRQAVQTKKETSVETTSAF